jgi:antitoxin component YwqK of YwqJK toxin-antitoxin module
MKILKLLLIALIISSCENQNEVLLKDCDAGFGTIKYEGELYTGKVKDLDEKGNLKLEFNVIDGKTDGDEIKYYSNGGTKSSVTKYKMGKIVSKIYYDEKGNVTGRE